MEGLMSCSSCGENFDLNHYRPKLLPCGHTLCSECIRNSLWGSNLTCPIDKKQAFCADPRDLQDDLQLVCWIEAASQGVLECVRCGCPFDGVLRRPAALDCGHTACRVCLQEAHDASVSASISSPQTPLLLPRRRTRWDSVDESWDYSQEDGDTCSSTSSLPTDSSEGGDGGVIGDLVVDCPVDGCMKGVRARDHHHLLGCVDGSGIRNHVKKVVRYDGGLSAEMLDKLVLLEEYMAGQQRALAAVLGPKMNGVLPTVGVDARSILGLGAAALVTDDVTAVDAFAANKRKQAGGQLDVSELRELLATLRRTIEHKASPRCEQPAVFVQCHNSVDTVLPDLVMNEKSQTALLSEKCGEEILGINSLKECKLELDVWDLSAHGSGEMRVKKEALLRSDSKVWKLTGVDCWCDPDWTLRLLRRVAPDVEQLQLRYPNREHLQLVRDAMPHLRRLEVRGWAGGDLVDEPFSFDGSPSRSRDTLEWLEVFLPMPTSLSLLRAHQRSLRKLRFMVSDEWSPMLTPSSGEDVSDEGIEVEDEDGFCVVPFAEDCLRSHCWDRLLEVYGGSRTDSEAAEGEGDGLALSSLSLLWPSSQPHDFWHCRRFARILRTARPHLAVDCEVCRLHSVADE